MGVNTNWIYNNYEFENRVNNLAWTVSGMYDEYIDSSEKDYLSKDVSLYFGIVAGARRKYIDWNIIKKYLMSRIKKGYDKEILLTLIQIVLNSVVENKVINERPVEIKGEMLVNQVSFKNKAIDVEGVFVIKDSATPKTLVPGLEVDGAHVKVDLNMNTNIDGCFACGDIVGKPYSYIKSAGQGQIAAINAVSYLDQLKIKEKTK